jgi:hypothetical protein
MHQNTFAHNIPFKWDPFLQKTHETLSDLSIVSDKMMKENFIFLVDSEVDVWYMGEETELLPQPSKGP